MNAAEALHVLRDAYDDRLGELRRRASSGSSVIGYFLNSIPVELILAAGLDPLRLVGDPARHNPIADKYLEEYFDGEVRSIFGSMLDGTFDAAGLIVVPRSSEVYLQLYYFLTEIPKWEPAAPLPPIYLFDLLQTPHWTTAQYDLGRMRAFAERLTAAGGKPTDETALRAAIETTNRVRTLLNEARALWNGPQPVLGGVDALKIIGATSILPPDRSIVALEALLGSAGPGVPRGPRLMLKGSPQSDPGISRLIEQAGAQLVAHDHVAGDSSYQTLIEEEGDPWEALARYYQSGIPGPRAYPQSAQDARFIALADEARVDGVIFFHDEWDDTLGWEYPNQKKLLDARGIPSLFMKRQPYFDAPVTEQARTIAGFVASIGKSKS